MKRILLLVLLCLIFGNIAKAQMTTRILRDSLFIPWELVYGPDAHIWFTQKNGYICRLNPLDKKIDTLYHETNSLIQGEGGMLGMALHPDFQTSPYIYVAYNYTQSGGYKERIVRYTYAGNVLQSPLTLLDNIPASSIHNGCRLMIIGDKLFITTGDAANQPTAQNLSSLSGKVLRLNLDGSIPGDNPFPNNATWSLGHRNAQGMVSAKNNIYISEHGPNNDDEVSIVKKGRNYGWPDVHGYCNTPAEITFCTNSNVVEPIKAWTPTLAVCGMTYYDHPMFPSMQNSLLMTTLKDQKLHQLQLNSTFDSISSSSVVSGINYGRLRAICVGPEGNIFIATSNSNSNGSTRVDKIIEIYDPSFVPVQIINSNIDEINIYPNPSSNEVNVNINLKQQQLTYAIITLDGKMVQTGMLNSGSNTLIIKDLPAGSYYLQVRDAYKIRASTKISKL